MTARPIEPVGGDGPIEGRCTGRSSRTGKWCRRYPVKGSKVCPAHGGNAPQVRRKAKQRRIEQATRRAAAEWVAAAAPIDSPLEALLNVAREITGFKDYLGNRLADLNAEAWRYRGEQAEQLRAEVGLYERALDRTARVLVDINRLGLEERRQTLNEQQGELLAGAMLRILDALDLSAEQQAKAVEVMPRELRAIEGGAA